MFKILLASAPILASIAVLGVLFVLGGAEMGLGMTVAKRAGIAAATGLLASLVFVLNKRVRFFERDTRQTRLLADRLLALLAVLPGGYCLFTPQGLLRESVRAAPAMGVEKISHIEDLVAAIKDAGDFLAAFRNLQQTGQAFDIQVLTAKDKPVQIAGRRFRVGREGSMIDLLWISDNPAAAEAAGKQAAGLAAAEKRAAEANALFDLMPIPMWTRGSDLNLTHCNAAYAKSLDAKAEDVISEQHELTSPTALGGSGRTLAANAVREGKPHNERRHVIIAGKRRLLDITEMPIKDANGETTALLGFAIDVTGEEDKDTALERHLSAQHEVLEHLGSAIAIYGADQKLEFYNHAYVTLWDADEGFLRGKPTFGEVLEDLRNRRRAPEQADFQRYKKERIGLFTSLLEPREDLMHLPDGTTLRILSAPHPFGGLIFVHEDVTDKLALESSYNTLIAVQRETLDNLAEGIAVFGPDGKLRLFNPAFARIWELPPNFLGESPHIADLLERMKPLFDFGDNWGSFKSEIVEYTLDRNPRKGRLERADQTVIEYSSIPLPDGAVLNSYLDVSDSIKVEQALRASNAALAAADRLKSEFVANVSYQLRTPLNTIMGFADILTNQYFGTLNERQLEYARTISEASNKLLLLINDVLDLATIEAGRMALNCKPIVIADLLNAAKQMTAEWARQLSLDIVIDCPSDLGAFEADENRMKQVLFNLIGNAIKYTPAGGRIALEARRRDAWIVLSVIDTGIGIPDSDRARVFGKFERANAQARQTGAGLGLSLVKSFVELHGGRIEISGNGAQGTRVSCFLPVKAQKAEGGDERGVA
jgi:signal transduction histidine kinase